MFYYQTEPEKDNDVLAITGLIVARRRHARDFQRHSYDV